MSFIALGINHTSAPVSLREKVAFSPDKMMHALQLCPQSTNASDLVILSTCNRTELYARVGEGTDPKQTVEDVLKWLADFHQVDINEVDAHAYKKQDEAAIEHLMRVACGLDSLIMGEPQILGQVKQALVEAKHAGNVSSQMERLFDATFTVAKRVRTETDIGANAVSVAFAAVQLAKQIFAQLERSRFLLIGAGETIELVAKHLSEAGAVHITVANRTLAKAQALAHNLAGDAITISQIPEHLAQADVVISSTASALPLIGQGMVETAVKARKHKPMLMIDLAVPRDIEPEVDNLDDVFLYTVDDLQNIVEQNVANREQAAQHAKTMIAEQVTQFVEWQRTHKNVDAIKVYRERAEATKSELLERALKQIEDGQDPQKVMQQFANKLSNTLMHGPTKAIQLASKKQLNKTLAVLNEALGLDDKN